jgi:hypothetical protein
MPIGVDVFLAGDRIVERRFEGTELIPFACERGREPASRR